MKYPIQALLTTTCLTAALAVVVANPARANPVDGTVVAGAATISTTGPKLDIVQTTDRAVIDWRSFNIAPNEHTQFYQPNSSSIAVNRVTSVDPSTIAGKLSANGNVVLINPNGVFFSKTATVDVNGLVATTADLDNSQFMNGGPLAFTKPGNANAAIINEGSITARDAGLVGLVAPNVINSGTITAKLGRVQLASGDSMTVDLYGDGLMEVKASDALVSQVVENSGRIHAAGGTIALSAAAGRATVNSVVKVTGELLAPSVAQKNGKIIIAAEGSNKTSKTGSSSVVLNNAVLDVSGRKAGERGGNISVAGDHVTIGAGSVLDASGDIGGGTVLLGGDYQGNGSLANAQYLTLEQGATVSADALSHGDGGRIILWADESTLFAGDLTARGGAAGGRGGFVETSGKHYLTVSGTVDLRAADGSAGTWLLDPTDITLTNRSTPGDLTNSFSAAQLETMSAGADIVLLASNNITFNMTGDTATLASGRSFSATANGNILDSSAGNIIVSGGGNITTMSDYDTQFYSQNFTALNSGTVDIRANRDIIIAGGAGITTNGGSITLNADRDISGGGDIQINDTAQLLSHGGDIIMGGGASPSSTYLVGRTNAAIQFSLGSTIDAGGGNISIKGQGRADAGCSTCYGIYSNGTTIKTSGTGTILLDGYGGGGGAATGNSGLYLRNAAISAGTGSISLISALSDSPTVTQSLRLTDGTTITSNGNMSLNAGAGTIVTGTISTGVGNLSIISDDLVIGGDLSGTGDLLLRPLSNLNVRINWFFGEYNIDTTEIAHLKDGWNKITIGHSGVNSISLGEATWSDNLSLIQTSGGFSGLQMHGVQTFTGGASANYTGAYIEMGNNITTDGGSVTLNGVTTSYNNAVISTSGGDVDFNGNVRVSAGGTPLNLNSGGGDITFGDTVFAINGSNAGKTVLLNAGSGTISFANTVNGDYNLTANAGNITLNGAWGGSEALGNVSLNAGTGTITAGAIAVGARNLTLISDSVALNGDLSGTGTLTLQPYSTTREVRLANGPQEYSLVATELDHLKDGWGNINIGRDDSTATLYVNYGTWSDPVTFLGNEAKTVYVSLVGSGFTFVNGWTDFYGNITTNGGDVVVTSNRADSALAYIDAGTLYSFGNTITTNGGNVSFQRYVPGTGTNTINTGNGNIVFQRDINRSYNTNNVGLVLNAGNGDITFNSTVNGTFGGGLLSLTASAANLIFNGAWGGTDALGNVSLTSLNNSFTIPTLTTAGNVLLNAGTGTVTTGAITTGAGNLSITADDVVLGGNLTGTGTLTLQPSSTNRIVRINDGVGDFNLSTAEITALQEGWSQILIGNTSSSADLLIGDAMFVDPVTFRSDSRKVIGAGKTLAGTDNASITFASGGWTDIYGAITTANRAITLDSIFMYSGSIASNGGAVTITNSAGWHNSSTGFSINSGGGNIAFNSTLYESGTSTAGKLLSLDAGTGTLSFGDTVNLAGNVTANASTLNFNGAWGNSTPLGDVSLTSVNALTLPSITASSIFARTTGALADIILANTSRLDASGAGNAITLASARNFINNSGSATPFTLSGGGRWLTYSVIPANDTLNGLTSSFIRTSCSYVGGCTGGTTIPVAGNGFIYSYTPVVVPPTPDPTPSTPTVQDLPPQVLRAFNIEPYMPRYVVIEFPVGTHTKSSGPHSKQRIETTTTSNSIDYDPSLSLTLSPSLVQRLDTYRDI